MLQRMLGTKIGMTQVFDAHGNVIPVTVINVGSWFVTQVKTTEKDGYNAVQIGCLRKRYNGQSFSPEWISNKKAIFLHLREQHVDAAQLTAYTVGQALTFGDSVIKPGCTVAVTSRSRGLGFQGVVKRWNFKGGPDTHGSTFHRKPGSLGNMRRQGEVLKGKRLPGRHGFRNFTTRGLTMVAMDDAAGCVFVKGAVPGKKDTLVTIKYMKA